MQKIHISIIICTYNRCRSLKDTLNSLSEQKCDGSFDYEIIVVDNNSNDETKKLVENCMAKSNVRLIYIFEGNQGLSRARNKGIKEAKGNIVVFTDDDVIADKSWLLNIIHCFEYFNCDALGGAILPLFPPNTPKWIKANQDLLYGPIVYHFYGQNAKIYEKQNMNPFVGANMAFKKECFDIKLFRTDLGVGTNSLGEETELFNELAKNNKIIYYCGNALVWHKVSKERLDLRYIAKWCIAAGRTSIRVNSHNHDNIIRYFGIPRYIFRKITQDTISLPTKLFAKREFIKKWMIIFVNIGRIIEFRKIKHGL